MNDEEIPEGQKRARECSDQIERVITPILDRFNCKLAAVVYLSNGQGIAVPVEVIPND